MNVQVSAALPGQRHLISSSAGGSQRSGACPGSGAGAARGCSRSPRGTSFTGRLALLAGLLAAALAVFLLGARPADAAQTHVLATTLTPAGLGLPTQIAVDNSTGDIYVLDAANNNIQRFDSEGNPADFPLLGSNVIDAVNGPDEDHHGYFAANSIAIDNSSGPNHGDIYVALNFYREVDVFLPSGKFAGALTATSDKEAAEFNSGGETCGVAVSANGNVFVAHSVTWAFTQHGFIDNFKPGIWKPDSSPAQDWPIKATLHEVDENSCHITADASNSVYLTTAGFIGTSPLKRYVSSLFDREAPIGKVIDPAANGAYADLVNGGIYVNESSRLARYEADGTLAEVFGEGQLGGFGAGGVAVDPSTGTVYATDLEGGIKVFEQVVTPDVDDVAASTTATAATVTATIGDAGAGAVTSCSIEYGPSDAYGSTAQCEPSIPPDYGASTDATVHLTGLDAESTYHYRVLAGNAAGETHSLDRTFTTHAVAGVTTEEPTDVTVSSATLKGSFTGNGEDTHYHFEWGSTTSYENSTPSVDAGSGAGPQSASAPITGLDVYTPYHVRLVASNASGTTYGPDLVFYSGPPLLPAISGTTASAVTATTAQLSALVNPGLGSTFYCFEYGTDTTYGSSTAPSEPIGSDDADHAISADISGLVPGTTYHFRAVATNFTGTTSGPDQILQTPSAPAVSGTSASAVTASTATLEALVRPGFRATTYHFEYGPGAGYGSGTPESASIGSDNAGHPVSAAIAGLAPGTVYHFRVVASNEIGATDGADGVFVTPPAPIAQPPHKPAHRCRKGFVKRHGKCVKKKKPKHRSAKKKHRKHKKRTHGSRG